MYEMRKSSTELSELKIPYLLSKQCTDCNIYAKILALFRVWAEYLFSLPSLSAWKRNFPVTESFQKKHELFNSFQSKKVMRSCMSASEETLGGYDCYASDFPHRCAKFLIPHFLTVMSHSPSPPAPASDPHFLSTPRKSCVTWGPGSLPASDASPGIWRLSIHSAIFLSWTQVLSHFCSKFADLVLATHIQSSTRFHSLLLSNTSGPGFPTVLTKDGANKPGLLFPS